MTGATIAKGIVSHSLAVVGNAAFFTVLTGVLYIPWAYAMAVSAADLMGSILTFILIPVLGGITGAAIGILGYFPLGWWARCFHFRRWLLVAGILTALFSLAGCVSWMTWDSYTKEPPWQDWPILLSSMGVYVVGGFFVYLSCLATAEDFIGR